MHLQYKNRYVAFIDVLGISDQMLATDQSENYAQAIYSLFSALVGSKKEVFFSLPHVRTGKEVQIQFDKPFGAYDKITLLSDAITMSFPERERDNEYSLNSRVVPILRCLQSVFWLQRGLLSLGVRTRGGISCGRLFHKRDMVLGEALVKAYRIESRAALYPRAVIDDELIKILLSDPIPKIPILIKNRIAHMVCVDTDGLYFVDYLGYDPIAGDFYLADEIDNILQETASDKMIAAETPLSSKLTWLCNYVSSSKECLFSDEARLQKNQGTKFGDVFKRSNDNIISHQAHIMKHIRSQLLKNKLP